MPMKINEFTVFNKSHKNISNTYYFPLNYTFIKKRQTCNYFPADLKNKCNWSKVNHGSLRFIVNHSDSSWTRETLFMNFIPVDLLNLEKVGDFENQ